MPKKLQPIDILKKYDMFTTSDASKLGISRYTLSRLNAKGKIQRVGYGLYIHEGSHIDPETVDYAYATYKFGPETIVGGLTALFYHGLIEQVPAQIWLIVPNVKATKDSKYRLIRVKEVQTVAVKKYKDFKITNLERTLVEALSYEKKIGKRVAMSSVIKALKNKSTTLENIMKIAKKLGKEDVVKKNWEAIIASMEQI